MQTNKCKKQTVVVSFDEQIQLEKLGIIRDNFEALYPVLGRQVDKAKGYITVDKDSFKSIIDNLYLFYASGNKMDYAYSKNSGEGRLFSTITGLQGISRVVRHTITKGLYYDLDIKNCHPEILRQYCFKNSIKCEILAEYCNNRDSKLKELQENHSINKDDAKFAFLSILNGGIPKIIKNRIDDSDCSELFIIKFYNELAQIRKEIYNKPQNKKLVKRAEKTKGADGFNLDGSVCNYLLCNHENKILEIMIATAQRMDIKIGVLCFDGLMVYQDSIKDENILNLFLEKCMKNIKNDMDFDFTIVQKSMDEGIDLSGYSMHIPEEHVGKIDADEEKKLLERLKLPFELNDECIGIFIVSQLEGIVFNCKAEKIIYTFDETTALWVGNSYEMLRILITGITAPLIKNTINEYKKILNKNIAPQEQVHLYNSKITLMSKGLEKLYSTSSQDKILKQISIRLPDKTNFIFETMNRINDFLFPIANKQVIDFRTLVVRDRTKEDYFTWTTDNEYDENYLDENNNKYDLYKYIEQILNVENVEDMEKYIENFIDFFGYMLTNNNSMKKIVLLIGNGNNGKSVFLKLWGLVIGEFGEIPNKRAFLQKKNSETAHSTELLCLNGKRSAFISELEKTEQFNVSLLKSITGDDKFFKIRGCGKDYKTAIIECKLLIASNEIPIFEDPVFEKRLIVFPFSNKFKVDPEAEKRILSMKKAFFNELCISCNRFYANNCKIKICKKLQDATKETLDSIDHIKIFLDTCCNLEESKDNKCKKKSIYDSFVSYCDNNSTSAIGRNLFYAKIITIYPTIIDYLKEGIFKNISVINDEI